MSSSAGSGKPAAIEPARWKPFGDGADVVLLHRVVERVAVVGERNRARAVAGADDRHLVETPGHAGARREVLEVLLHVQGVVLIAVAGDADRVRSRDRSWRACPCLRALTSGCVVLPAQPEVDGHVGARLPLVLHVTGTSPSAWCRGRRRPSGRADTAAASRAGTRPSRWRRCVVDALSAGLPVPEALKVNRPRGPPAILRLQQHVAVVAQFAAQLDGVRADQPGQCRRARSRSSPSDPRAGWPRSRAAGRCSC